MNTAAIITQVISEVNRSDLTRAQVLQYLNNRKKDIENFNDYYFMEGTATAPTVALQQSYALPDDYKDELQLWLVDSTGTIKTPLVKWLGSEAEKNYAQPNFYAKPFAYWVWQDAYFLYPIPDTTYTLWLKYYKYSVDYVDSVGEEFELEERFPKLLIFGAVSDAYHYFQQPDKVAEWESKVAGQMQLLERREGKKVSTNYDRRLKIRMK